jgi:hypothetical protein
MPKCPVPVELLTERLVVGVVHLHVPIQVVHAVVGTEVVVLGECEGTVLHLLGLQLCDVHIGVEWD